MKVLVTGGAGFIGSHIVDALLLRGHDVLVMDDYSSGRRENLPSSTHCFMPGSITWRSEKWRGHPQHTAIDVACDDWRPDVICHQAAQPSLRSSLDDPAHDAMVNIIGTLNVIQAAKACGAHVVFASTSAVYADRVGSPIPDGWPTGPTTPYGLSKLTAEHYIGLLAPSYTILRYGNVYGPRQVQVGENQLIPHCLAHLLGGEPFVINGDGEQTRDFVYVGDIARANVLAIEGKVQGIFNCGSGHGVPVARVCGLLAMAVGRTEGFDYGPAKAGEARHVALDSSRARTVLGWRSETRLPEGLNRTIAWWKEHRCASV